MYKISLIQLKTQILYISIVARRFNSTANAYDSMTYGLLFDCDVEVKEFVNVCQWDTITHILNTYTTRCDQHT